MENMTADALADILYGDGNAVADVKIMPGTDSNASPDEVARELWLSMVRNGLIKDGKVVNRNAV